MAASRLVSQVAFGGNAINNPPDYSWTTYDNYPDLNLGLSYLRMNVIFFEDKLGVNLEVTGLVVLNDAGQPLLGPNDLVYLPCPPTCY